MDQHRYRVVLRYDQEKQQYFARAPELEHCSAEGATQEAALAALADEIGAQIENMREAGQRPPRPLDEQEWPGEITLKLSSSLRRELEYLAHLEELPVNQLACEILGRAIEQRLEERPRRRRGPAPVAGAPEPPPVDEAAAEDQPPPRRDEDPRRAPVRRDRGGNQDRYHAIMDDRANFIEYVRSLETGGAAPKGPPRRRR
jgi:predicted RNase H-like HicB family nuclease